MTERSAHDEGLAVDASFDRVVGQLAIRGELTGETKEQLWDAVAAAVEQGVKLVRIDLDQVTSLDSSGLTQLLLTQQRLAASDVGVQLANVPPRLARIMEVTRTDSIFDIVSY
jgi:anti-anti-sigma factor